MMAGKQEVAKPDFKPLKGSPDGLEPMESSK